MQLSKIPGYVNFVQAWIQPPISWPSPPPRSRWNPQPTCALLGQILSSESMENTDKVKDNQWKTL